ncbi:helix-turn-helix transcriptional regulator [Chromobacterium violaceum]|uniref:helix-turn-helix transcriptional regulator n=1 Tax=Chromobacterium violaceum TaxID=536 RepID=UPI001C8CCB0D|nr:AlpA family transcriptional regulator [Chromobacterium violaceum]MBX9267504.1 AlpA family transcriptional regulator [Chromobacterium violaceum]
MADHSLNIPTILRRKQVEARTGLSRTTIYDRINPKSPRYDQTFPTPVSLGAGAVGWVESEITAWIESRVSASRQAA